MHSVYIASTEAKYRQTRTFPAQNRRHVACTLKTDGRRILGQVASLVVRTKASRIAENAKCCGGRLRSVCMVRDMAVLKASIGMSQRCDSISASSLIRLRDADAGHPHTLARPPEVTISQNCTARLASLAEKNSKCDPRRHNFWETISTFYTVQRPVQP